MVDFPCTFLFIHIVVKVFGEIIFVTSLFYLSETFCGKNYLKITVQTAIRFVFTNYKFTNTLITKFTSYRIFHQLVLIII